MNRFECHQGPPGPGVRKDKSQKANININIYIFLTLMAGNGIVCSCLEIRALLDQVLSIRTRISSFSSNNHLWGHAGILPSFLF